MHIKWESIRDKTNEKITNEKDKKRDAKIYNDSLLR